MTGSSIASIAISYRDDLAPSEYIVYVGWRRIRVIAGHRKTDIVRRVRQAWPLTPHPSENPARISPQCRLNSATFGECPAHLALRTLPPAVRG